jgi:hypothetical protein
MKKKHAPEQYAAKPKSVTVPVATGAAHPAMSVAKKLVQWMDRGEVPPSVILLHGLYLARTSEKDGLPVDTYRPQLKMQGTDSKAISEILNVLARPQADKIKVIALWLQSVWVKKSVGASRILSSKKEHKKSIPLNKLVNRQKKAQESSLTKPEIVVKKKK